MAALPGIIMGIESAPKDGTEILVYREDAGWILARWIAPCDFLNERELEKIKDEEEQDWFYADFIAGGRLNDGAPTHWMPLPDSPAFAALARQHAEKPKVERWAEDAIAPSAMLDHADALKTLADKEGWHHWQLSGVADRKLVFELEDRNAKLVAENEALKARRVTAEMVKAATDNNVEAVTPKWQAISEACQKIADEINVALNYADATSEKCEGCGDPAICHDPEGVPLCVECAKPNDEF